MFLLILSVIVVVFEPTATAALDCQSASATQATLNQCADQYYRAADARLNAEYQTLEKALGDNSRRRAELIAAQRRWLQFRDAECRFAAAGAAGGSMQPLSRSSCLERLTNERVAQLKAYHHCPEGDVVCVPGS